MTYYIDAPCSNTQPHPAHTEEARMTKCPGVQTFAVQQARWKYHARMACAVLFVAALLDFIIGGFLVGMVLMFAAFAAGYFGRDETE